MTTFDAETLADALVTAYQRARVPVAMASFINLDEGRASLLVARSDSSVCIAANGPGEDGRWQELPPLPGTLRDRERDDPDAAGGAP